MVETMHSIRDGNLNEKMVVYSQIREFNQVEDTFNEMMTQISNLKIEAYEQEFELQKLEMQTLQRQIHPHFYLNCLKNLFGMAEERKHKQIQEMIIVLSDYLRNMFRNQSLKIPLSVELHNVERYIDLIKMSASFYIEYNLDWISWGRWILG